MAEDEYKGARKRLSRMFGLSDIIPPFGGGGIAPPSGPPPPPLDLFSESILIGVSMRKLFNSYNGDIIEITNSNASANTTIGVGPGGVINMSQLLTWVQANPPYPIRVRVWYNQNPGFPNFRYINTDVTKLPVITDGSGNIYMNNGLPCIKFGFNNLPTYLSLDANLYNSKYFVLSDVNQDPSNGQIIITYPSSQTDPNIYGRGSMLLQNTGGTLITSESLSTQITAGTFASSFPPQKCLIHSQHNTSTLFTDVYYNGSFISASSRGPVAQPNVASYMHIGCNVSGDATTAIGTQFFKGNMQEIIVYSQPKENYRIGITENIKQYWGL